MGNWQNIDHEKMVFNLLSVNILFGIPCQENEASTRTFGSLQVWADYLASRLLGGRPFLPSFRNLLEISGKKMRKPWRTCECRSGKVSGGRSAARACRMVSDLTGKILRRKQLLGKASHRCVEAESKVRSRETCGPCRKQITVATGNDLD